MCLGVWGVARGDDVFGDAEHGAHAGFVGGFGGEGAHEAAGEDPIDEGEVRSKFKDGEEGGGFLDIVVDVFVAGEVAEGGAESDAGENVECEVLGQTGHVD